jgi:prephenate dehydrogenase
MAQVNLTIIGLQRLGTSFGLAVQRLKENPDIKHEFIITGSDEDRDILQEAHKKGAIDQEVRDLESAVEKADLVFLASPYGIAADVFSMIGPALKPGAVVMDTSPVKLASIAWADKHFRRNDEGQSLAYLVGTTAMLNPAHLNDPGQDMETAYADLFDGGLFVLSPAPDCPEEAVQLVADLAALMGVKLHFADPAEHDGLIASMEGLPILLQLALFRSLNNSQAWDDLRRFGNTTFALATHRLSSGAPGDLAALVTRNRANILRSLETLIGTLEEVRDLVATGDEEAVEGTFADAMDRYERWQIARRKSDWGDRPPTPQMDARGLLGGLFVPLGMRRPKDRPGGKRPKR